MCKRILQRLRAVICIIFSYLLLQPLAGENSFYEFGPRTDKVIVFTALASSDNQSTTASIQLQAFAQKLSVKAPDVHIIVAITKNDISELPGDIPVKRYEGIKSLIQTLSVYPNAAVCLIDSGKPHTARIVTGTSQGTSPAWLLRPAYACLRQKNITVDFYTNAVVFHRLGWLPDDPALRLYNEAGIPTIKIETNAELSDFFDSFAPQVIQSISNEWDTHYFVWRLRQRLIIISEWHIIVILISCSIVFLLWLIFFSFLFGKKREQHLRDLLKLWWMPGYFFLVNWGSFFLGSKITELLFYLRFSSTTEMHSLPLTALSVKYVFALFFMFMFTAFNKFIPLPANRFIYGFMAHAVCLLNIFVFSFINLSFSIIFMLIYFVSLIAYQFKNIILQILFIVCLFLPLMPFVMHVIAYRYYMFTIIFFFNLAPACIFVPFDLFLIRLSLSIDKKKKNTKPLLKIPFHCKLTGSFFIALVLLIFFMPVSQSSFHNTFTLIHCINGTESYVIKKYTDPPLEEKIEQYFHNEAAIPQDASRFLTVGTSLDNYFERSIGTITVDSPLKIEAFSVTVHAQNGVAVFESDTAFEQSSSGDTATFISFPRPVFPGIIHFSGKKDAILTVSVVLWSKENPFNIKLAESTSNAYQTAPDDAHEEYPFLLKVEKTLHITASGLSNDNAVSL